MGGSADEEDAETLIGVAHTVEAVGSWLPSEIRSLSQNLKRKSFGVDHPLVGPVANGVAHDGSKGGAELLSNSERDGTLVPELPRQCDAHVHADFKHDKIINLCLECAQSLVVEQKRFWKLTASVAAKRYRSDCTCEDLKLEAGSSPWSRRALRSKFFNRVGEPVPCRADVDS